MVNNIVDVSVCLILIRHRKCNPNFRIKSLRFLSKCFRINNMNMSLLLLPIFALSFFYIRRR